MRLAPLLCLLPALATAQDIPSLQRPGVALPITDAIPVLRTRIGGPGGPSRRRNSPSKTSGDRDAGRDGERS